MGRPWSGDWFEPKQAEPEGPPPHAVCCELHGDPVWFRAFRCPFCAKPSLLLERKRARLVPMHSRPGSRRAEQRERREEVRREGAVLELQGWRRSQIARHLGVSPRWLGIILDEGREK